MAAGLSCKEQSVCRLHERELPASTCLIWFTKFAFCAPSGVALPFCYSFPQLEMVPSTPSPQFWGALLFRFSFKILACIRAFLVRRQPQLRVCPCRSS